MLVADEDRRVQGWIPVADLDGQGKVGDVSPHPFDHFVTREESLRAALDAMVESPTGVAVRVDGDRRYEGVVTHNTLTKKLL